LLTGCALIAVLWIATTVQSYTAASQTHLDAAPVREALANGNYALAETRARDWLERNEALHGPASPETADALDVLVESLVKNGRGTTAEAQSLADRAVALRLAADSGATQTATALQNLGAVLVKRGEFTRAIEIHTRALAIRQKRVDGSQSALADSLDHLATGLIGRHDFAHARSILAKGLLIRRTHRVESPAELARTLRLLALVHRYSGDHAVAISLLDEAIEIRRETAWLHPDTADVLDGRAWAAFTAGDLTTAHKRWSEALDVFQATLRPGHPTVAITQRGLAIAEAAFGNLSIARRLRQSAFDTGSSELAACDPEMVGLLNDLGLSLQYDGDYADARALFGRQLGIIKQCIASGNAANASDMYATTVYNQAMLAAEMGELREAETLYQRAIDLWGQALGTTHPFVARGLDSFAETLASRRQFSRARRLYERALSIRSRTLGPNHPHVAWTLTNIAETVAAGAEPRRAEAFLTRALSIFKSTGPADEPDYLGRALALRGMVEAQTGRHDAARALLAEALQERERVFGPTHPLAAETRGQIALAEFALGSYSAALASALTAEAAGREHLEFTVRHLPERHAALYAAKRPKGLDLALSVVAAGQSEGSAMVLDSALRSRGIILDELADRMRIDFDSDPQLAALIESMNAARQRFATLMLRSLQRTETVPRALLDAARTEKENAERELAERSALLTAELARARSGLVEVRAALPPRSAIVSYVRYNRWMPAAPNSRLRSVPSYLAFVVRSDSESVHVFPLGTAASMDSLVSAWREEVTGKSLTSGTAQSTYESAYVAAGTRLRSRIWDPIKASVADLLTVFIVPDGVLNVVSFAALPTTRTRYLLESAPVIHYLSTERDLVPLRIEQRRTAGLLAVGGPAFDAPVARGGRTGMRATGCRPLRALTFYDLPESRSEAQEVAQLWSPALGGTTILVGPAATETAVKQAASGHRIVHLATHGFFLGSDCRPQGAGNRAVGGLVAASTDPANDAEPQNALLRAGLAFAGANRLSPIGPTGDDGILTAEEVAGLNLRGTEWAVLSACDTGIGEIRAGEGVYGLRRAFQIAGVRTVIMSLWSVDDEATRQWMRWLYDARFSRSANTVEAVHDATLKLLKDRRARGLSAHPYYWAAFIAAGNWR
jgi:CHAT domain-containing protein/tetratricopeptide (TPR) repeat protein